jgi:septal ring factor EnvC (AmiA/AmiB activator)
MCKQNIGLLVLFFLSCWELLAQEPFASLYSDLDELDQVIASLSGRLETQQKLLQALNEKIKNSETELTLSTQEISDLRNISETQALYVNQLLVRIQTLEQIRQEQLRYQQGLKRELLAWKIGGVSVGIISIAGITASLVWSANK